MTNRDRREVSILKLHCYSVKLIPKQTAIAGDVILAKKAALSFMLLLLPGQLLAAVAGMELQQVSANVYAIVGDMGQRSAKNLGNNSTHGFVVTRKGVVLIDSGASKAGAKAIETLIHGVTKKPVVKVINSGGQDHRWLGNAYFKAKGAEIIASNAAVKDQKARLTNQFMMLGNLVGETAVKSTEAVYADSRFDQQYEFQLGATTFQLFHFGTAHTPGDIAVWLPQEKVVFGGDIIFVERMLGVSNVSNSKSWIKVFESIAALHPKYVVPGHGHVTNLQSAKKDTYFYLLDLRRQVKQFMQDGHDISDIGKLKFSKYQYLKNYDSLAGRNAQQVYIELEWE